VLRIPPVKDEKNDDADDDACVKDTQSWESEEVSRPIVKEARK
jgi:hypothetical protein